MGTLQNPGRFDCYAKLKPDEPFFVLKASDPLAAELVELWAIRANSARIHTDKVRDAHQISEDMIEWRSKQLGGG